MGWAPVLVGAGLFALALTPSGCVRADEGGAVEAAPAPFVRWEATEPERATRVFEHDRGAEGTFRLEEIMSGGLAVFDADGDADLDLFFVHGDPRRGSFGFFENSGGGAFVDRSSDVEATPEAYGMGCAAGDFDGDGWVDLYVTCVGPDLLLRNEGGERFIDVTESAGLGDEGFGSSAAWFDADLDGDLDLYLVRYVDRDSPKVACRHDRTGAPDYCSPLSYRPVSDRLYRNDEGRFTDVSESAGIAAKAGYGLAVLCSDLDSDGALDVFVANDQSAALFWRNRGDGSFEETALAKGCAYDRMGRAYAGMGVVAEDFDGDLDLDLCVTNIREQEHLVFDREGKTFTHLARGAQALGWSRPFTGFGIACFDQDLDGGLDLYVANGDVAAYGRPDRPYAQPDSFARWCEGRFVDASAELRGLGAGVSRAVATGDLDGDGDLDLVVGVNGGRPAILRNEAAGGGHWLVVSVRDESGRVELLNSRVTVSAGGRKWVRELRAQESYLTSRDPRAHFGLGATQRADEVAVRFADGRETVLRDVALDRVLVVTRPGGEEEQP